MGEDFLRPPFPWKDRPHRLRRGIALGRRVVGVYGSVAERDEREAALHDLLDGRAILALAAIPRFAAVRMSVENAHRRIVHERMVAAEVRIDEGRRRPLRLRQIHQHVEGMLAHLVAASHNVLASLRRPAEGVTSLHEVERELGRLRREPAVDVLVEELDHARAHFMRPLLGARRAAHAAAGGRRNGRHQQASGARGRPFKHHPHGRILYHTTWLLAIPGFLGLRRRGQLK